MAFKYILISIIDRFATNTSPHAALLFEFEQRSLNAAASSCGRGYFRKCSSCGRGYFYTDKGGCVFKNIRIRVDEPRIEPKYIWRQSLSSLKQYNLVVVTLHEGFHCDLIKCFWRFQAFRNHAMLVKPNLATLAVLVRKLLKCISLSSVKQNSVLSNSSSFPLL